MEWLAVVIVFSVMILVHEFGHFLTALKVGVKVEAFSLGLGPKLFSFKRGGIEYKVSAIPFGGYVKMAGDEPDKELKGQPWEFLSAPVANRLKIVFAGPLLNYILGFILFSLVFYVGYPTLTSRIGGLVDGYPAKAAGIKAEDKIMAIDGKTVSNWEEVTGAIRKKTQGPMALTVERAGAKMDISVIPQVKETKDILGKKVRIAQIGITPSEKVEYTRYGFFKSFWMGGKKLIDITVLTYRGLWSLITGQLPFKESVSGPVGIFNFMAAAARMGIMPLLQLTAYISALLAIFNLLPIPALDGGYILFFLTEKIRGKPFSRKAQETAMQVGWTFLIALMLFATYNDIFRLMKK